MKNTLLFSLLFIFSSTLLPAQIPTYFNLRERLTKNGNADGDPIRDARIELKIYILENGATVFEEIHPDVKTNYDGFISIKVGDYNPAGLGNLDWQNVSKTIKIESRTYGSTGTYNRTYEDRLPVAAFAQLGRPSSFIKPSGEVQIFSHLNHPNIKIKGNSAAQYPYLDFSVAGSDFHTRMGIEESSPFAIRTSGAGLEIDAGNGLGYVAKGGINFHASEYRFNISNIKTNGFLVFDPGNSTQIGVENNNLFAVRTNGIGIDFDAGAGKDYPQKGAINFHASGYNFTGEVNILNAPLRVTGSATHNEYITYSYLTRKNKDIDYGHCITCSDVTYARGSLGTATDKSDYSIFVNKRVLAEEFDAISDARIKKYHSIINKQSSIDIISKLKIINYSYVDKVLYGKKLKTGFFAQEVETILPEAISKMTDVIPNVFQLSKDMTYDSATQTLALTIDSLTDIKPGDILRLIGNKEHLLKVVEVNNTTIKIKDWPEKDTKEVFVYGKQVDDFRVVDYDRIFTLNVSATQALIQEVEGLKKQVEELQAYVKTLEVENTALNRVLTSLESRVGNIEKQFSTTTSPSTGSH